MVVVILATTTVEWLAPGVRRFGDGAGEPWSGLGADIAVRGVTCCGVGCRDGAAAAAAAAAAAGAASITAVGPVDRPIFGACGRRLRPAGGADPPHMLGGRRRSARTVAQLGLCMAVMYTWGACFLARSLNMAGNVCRYTW